MANLNGFDASQVDPATAFDPIPAGKYFAVITESETKQTKAGDGNYLQLTFTVLEGPYSKRKVWARLNLNNPKAETVKIARAELSAICRAVGVLQPKDSVELHNIPLVITVKLKKRDDTGEMTNEVKGYAKREAAGQAAAGQTQQAPANSTTPPWRR